MNIKKTIFLIYFSFWLTGCVSPKTYVDPSFSKATYDDVKPVENKYSAKILIEFQRNGKPYKRANKEVRGHVERTLRATGVVTPTTDESKASLMVTVNNIADINDAKAKGFGTGLTLGAVGTLVTDYYEIFIEFDDGDGNTFKENYKHALHTTIGNKKAPFEGVEGTTPADGFGTVVEQTLLNFIKDMQSKGILTLKLESSHRYS